MWTLRAGAHPIHCRMHASQRLVPGRVLVLGGATGDCCCLHWQHPLLARLARAPHLRHWQSCRRCGGACASHAGASRGHRVAYSWAAGRTPTAGVSGAGLSRAAKHRVHGPRNWSLQTMRLLPHQRLRKRVCVQFLPSLRSRGESTPQERQDRSPEGCIQVAENVQARLSSNVRKSSISRLYRIARRPTM